MGRVMALLLHDVYRGRPAESGFAGAAADRYKLPLAEFQAQLLGLAPHVSGATRTESPWVVTDAGLVAVTVDDGGVSYHGIVADRLEAFGLRGYCLVTTGWVGRRGFLQAAHLRELAARGHVIGTHSVSHPARFSACGWDRMLREWSDSRDALEGILGYPVTTGSVPGGYFSRRVAEAAAAAGLTLLFTSEPTTRVSRVGDCDVIGRFTVRPGSRADFAGEIARGHAPARLREWAAWNAKKLLKHTLGAAYPGVAGRWHRVMHGS